MSEWDHWDVRFLQMAQMVASWSKDPSTKCGAVIVRPDHSVVSLGFNGFPRRICDDPTLLAIREEKYKRVVHAEMNAILQAKQDLAGCTLYSWPPNVGPSCERCSVHMIQAGLAQVVYVHEDTEMTRRWADSSRLGLELFDEAGVKVIGVPRWAFDGDTPPALETDIPF